MRSMIPVLAVALVAAPLSAQQGDRGVFEIQRGEMPLGREEFSVQPGGGGGAGGSTIASLARYPATRPTIQIQTVVERDANGAVTALQLDTRRVSGVSRVYGAAVRGNLTVRQSTPEAESVREYPRAAGIVVLDESVFALYRVVAEQATPAGARLPVLFPRSGKRGQLTATRTTPTTVEMSGVIEGTLTLDTAGNLERVMLADGTSALRQPR